MKFLCPSCKAKYQIADEKVSGRALKMVCRQCGEEIVIRGDGARGAQGREVAARPAQQPVPAPAVAAGQASAPVVASAGQGAAAVQWHVAIDDTPVGPLHQDEVERKMAVGQLNADSLAWRDGLDDWLPIKQISELHTLWKAVVAKAAAQKAAPRPRRSTAADVPAPAPAGGRVAAASGGALASRPRHATQSHGRGAAASSTSAAMAASASASAATAESPELSQPTTTALAPVGLTVSEPAAETTAAPQPLQLGDDAGAGIPGRRRIRWGPVFALVCGSAFILAIGAFIGVRVFMPKHAPSGMGQLVGAVASGAEGATKTAEGKVVAEGDGEEVHRIVLEPEDIAGDSAADDEATPKQKGVRRRRASKRRAARASNEAGGNAEELTAEQREMLDRMGGGYRSPAGLQRDSSGVAADDAAAKRGLRAEQLATVVNRGKRSLQRCYETALRGSGSEETVRLDVEITVSPRGNVTNVTTRGRSLPGMEKCISSTARTWRFPASANTTKTQFPILFQPGA